MLSYSKILAFKEQLKGFWDPVVERCGTFDVNHKLIEVENRSKNPEFTFAFGIEDLEDGPVASWHSHPTTTANLSIDDYRFFQAWPEMIHFIVGIDEVRCYQVQDRIVFCVDDEADYTPRASEKAAP